MTRCCVYGCSSIKSQHDSRFVSFFNLPKDLETCKAWLQLFERNDLLEKKKLNPKNHIVCSLHFEESMMSVNRKLLSYAYPTRNLPSMIQRGTLQFKNISKHEVATQTSDTEEFHCETNCRNEEKMLTESYDKIPIDVPYGVNCNVNVTTNPFTQVFVRDNATTTYESFMKHTLLGEFTSAPDMIYSQRICRVCLSYDRDTTVLADLKLFQSVTGIWETSIFLCWECESQFQRVQNFKLKSHNATKVLQCHGPVNSHAFCMSTLVRTHLNLNSDFEECRKKRESSSVIFIPSDSEELLKVDLTVSDDLSGFSKRENLVEERDDQYEELESVSETQIVYDLDEDVIKEEIQLTAPSSRKEASLSIPSRADPVSRSKNTVRQPRSNRKQKRVHKKLEMPSTPPPSGEGTLYDVIYETQEQYKKRKDRYINKTKCKNWYCGTCFKHFASDKYYVRHLETFHVKDGVRCPICSVSCPTETQTKEHMDQTHSVFKCRRCRFAFDTRRRIEKHCIVHGEKQKKYICETCGWKTSSQSYMKKHRLNHSGSKYECDICGKSYPIRISLVLHLRRHTTSVLCELCGRTFYSQARLNLHKLAHLGPEARKHVCEVCQKRFGDNFKLVAHVRTHTGERPFPCNACDMKFITKSQMKLHARRIHAAELTTTKRKYKCVKTKSAYINKRIGNKMSDVDKIKGEKKRCGRRPDQKSYICDICQKDYKSKWRLLYHLPSHSDSRPYKCEDCNLTFKYQGNLWEHKLTHGEKSFQCNICGWKFHLKGNLTSHMLTHTDIKRFECEVCGSKFRLNRNLKNHKKIHMKDLSTAIEKLVS